MTAASDSNFAPIAQQVARRVALRRWLSWLGRTLWIAVGGVAALALIAIISGSQTFSIFAWIALALWLVAPLAYILWQRPGIYSVLALWDQAAGRREAFASAWWFEQQSALTEAQQAHIEAQRAILPEAKTALARDLPLQPHRWLWLPPRARPCRALYQRCRAPRARGAHAG